MLLAKGSLDGAQILRPQTVEALVARHRVGLLDKTFDHIIDWGLGFIINSNQYGIDTLPYGYGPHASQRTFGHSGSQSSCAFADPENELVVAWRATHAGRGETPAATTGDQHVGVRRLAAVELTRRACRRDARPVRPEHLIQVVRREHVPAKNNTRHAFLPLTDSCPRAYHERARGCVVRVLTSRRNSPCMAPMLTSEIC
jgi:hypothetical protein